MNNPQLNYHENEWQKILNRRFHTDSPESEPNVCQELPSDYMNAELEFSYDLKEIRPENAWCSHCKKYNHQKGFLMRTKSGYGFMIGKDCGERLFGLEFNKNYNIFRQEKEKQSRLIRFDKARHCIDQTIKNFEDLTTHEAFSLYNSFQSNFRVMFPELHGELLKRINLFYSELTLTISEPDNALQRQLNSYKDELNLLMEKRTRRQITVTEMKNSRSFLQSQINYLKLEIKNKPMSYVTKNLNLGNFAGPDFISEEIKLEIIKKQLHKMKAIKNISHTDKVLDMKNNEISQLLEEIKTCCKVVLECVGKLKNFTDFHNTENILKVCKWANLNPECSGEYVYHEASIKLYEHVDDNDPIEYIIPNNFRLPSMDGLQAMLKALSH